MLFSSLGYLLRPVGQAAWWATQQVGKAAWKGALVTGGLAAKGARAAAPHVAKAAGTAASDTVHGATRGAQVALDTAKGLYDLTIKKAPEGAALSNMFTGRKLRRSTVLAMEVGGIGYALHGADRSTISHTAMPAELPAMTHSGHAAEMAQYSYDPLMGARGGMAFALHRLRHG